MPDQPALCTDSIAFHRPRLFYGTRSISNALESPEEQFINALRTTYAIHMRNFGPYTVPRASAIQSKIKLPASFNGSMARTRPQRWPINPFKIAKNAMSNELARPSKDSTTGETSYNFIINSAKYCVVMPLPNTSTKSHTTTMTGYQFNGMHFIIARRTPRAFCNSKSI